jgi:hypothetical protein
MEDKIHLMSKSITALDIAEGLERIAAEIRKNNNNMPTPYLFTDDEIKLTLDIMVYTSFNKNAKKIFKGLEKLLNVKNRQINLGSYLESVGKIEPINIIINGRAEHLLTTETRTEICVTKHNVYIDEEDGTEVKPKV